VAAAAVLTATGCAGAGASGSSSLGGGASLVPSDAAAFVAVDTDLSSSQWHVVDGLLAKFPARDALLTSLRQRFEQGAKVSWADDVRPALGPEVDLVALGGSPRRLAALVQPDDRAKLDALLEKLGGHVVSRQLGGWTALADNPDALAALEHVTAPLADDQRYQAATAKLAPDALVRAYADGALAERLLTSLPGQVVATTPPVRGRGPGVGVFAPERYAWGSADVLASDDGIRVEAYTRAGPPSLFHVEHARLLLTRIRSYTPLLLDEIPAGAVLVADYEAVPGGFENVQLSNLPAWLRRLYAKSPNLPNELDNLLGGETAIYASPGLPMPELTLVTQPPDVDRAIEILPDALQELERSFPQLGQLTLHHAVLGGQLVLSTSQRGIADFRAPGKKLSDDPDFQAAAKASGLPQQTTGFVYANLQAALPLLSALAPKTGLGDITALRSLTAFGTKTGAESSYTLFLAFN
jgi:hypothetical protein